MNSKTEPKCISSTASPVGRTPSTSPAGQELDLFGAPVSLAKVSPALDKAADSRMAGDSSGFRSLNLSKSADLSASLASRLKQRLDSAGSIEYSAIWKRRATPAGRLYWEHTASAHRTSDKDCSGWQTPRADESTSDRKPSGKPNLQGEARLTGWNTPRATDGSNGGPNQTGGALPADAAQLSGWTTPNGDDANNATRDSGQFNSLVRAAGWATPQACDSRGATGPASQNKELGRDVLLTSGPTQSGTNAATGKPGESHQKAKAVLNPFFSAWLMGFPVAWTIAGLLAMQRKDFLFRKGFAAELDSSKATETPSCQNSPRSSSKP